MPRLHFVKKARKTRTFGGLKIKKGQSYYWWAFRVGRSSIKHASIQRPRRSQLTMSNFYAQLWDTEDDLSASAEQFRNAEIEVDNLRQACESAADAIENLGSECQDKHDNMPESLQDGETGQLLQDRADKCEELAETLRNLPDEWDEQPEEEFEESDDDENDETDTEEPSNADEIADWRHRVADSVSEADFSID